MTNERVKRPATNVLQAIMGTHWMITEEGLETILAVAQRENESPEAVAARLGRPLDNTRTVTIREGVATIPVTGPLLRYANIFTEISGGTTYTQLATDLRAALDDRSVRAILLDIDSPGGDANGVSQLSAMIRAATAEKPITAFVGGSGASAAYWLASAASAVVVSDTAILGSIGVRSAYTDRRAIDEARGVKTIEIVSSQSPNKRMDPTEDVGRAQLQKVIDDLADVFIAAVAANRGVTVETVLADFGQGGVFVGRLAVEQGLADAVGTYESTLAELRDRGLDAVTSWRRTSPARASLTTLARDLKMEDSTKAGGASSEQSSGAPTDPATPPATATTDTPATATVTAPELIAQARAEAATQERERIASIRKLGASADAALVEQCIADGVTAEAAARCFLEADQSKAAARLLALKGDENSNPAPATTTAGNGEPDSDRAKAKEILAVHATVAPPRPTTHRSR